MRVRAGWTALALAIVLSIPAPGQDVEAPELVFYSPSETEPAAGETAIDVDVFVEGVEEMIFLVDGIEVGRMKQPPFRLVVPIAESFQAHRFEAVAMGTAGVITRGVLETPPLRIDERIDLGLQQLYVTVDPASGQESTPLEAHEFRLRDNGVPQQIVTFERGDAALTVALLVDASDSMRGGHLEAALEGARSFLGGMRELDEAALYLFSDSIRYRSAFLQDDSGLRQALASVEAGGGTAINDALYLAIRQVEERQGRRVVVLLSDGSDIHSALQMRDVLWSMHRSRSLIYWIALNDLAGDKTSPWRTSELHRRERDGLRQLVTESGGRVVPIATPADAAVAFQDILAELRRQYVIGYYPARVARDGSWHSVSVRVDRKGHRIRTRGGYVAH